MRRLLIPFAFVFLTACSTSNRPRSSSTALKDQMPPEYTVNIHKDATSVDKYLQDIGASTSLDGVKWWSQYRRGQVWQTLDAKKSCKLFSELAQQKAFPLHDLALLRAHQVCDSISQLAPVPETMKPWFADLQTDVELAEAQRQGDQKKIMMLSVSQSKQSKIVTEKVQLTQAALKIAEQLGDHDMINKLHKRLYHLAPRLNKKPKDRDLLRVAYDWRRVRKFKKALHFYSRAFQSKKSSYDDKITALRGIRAVYKLRRDRHRYVRATQALARYVANLYRHHHRNAKMTQLYHDTWVLLARTYWTVGRANDAKRVLKVIARRLRHHYSLAEVYWLRGRMMAEDQKFAGAVWWFEKALKETFNDSEFENRVKWYLAWNARKLKKYKRAAQLLTDLKASADNPFDQSQYSFWLAKTHNDQGQKELSQKEFKALIKSDPIGYYGLLAHYELHLPLAQPGQYVDQRKISSVASSKSSKENNFVDNLDPVYIKWLLAVEENDVAKAYLDQIAQSYRQQNIQSEHVWLTLFNDYARAGKYIDLFAQLNDLDPEERQTILDMQPELLFPTPYKSIVKKSAHEQNVPEEFIYAIMRQESAFNPRARSHADAFGLLQILPQVAQAHDDQAGVEYSTAQDLFDPKVNIPIGTAVLKFLSKKYDHQFILTVASYNANADAIRGWMKTRFRGDPLEFIEDIPYPETQAYIKLVMRNYIFYKVLNAKDKTAVLFPAWCLELRPSPTQPPNA